MKKKKRIPYSSYDKDLKQELKDPLFRAKYEVAGKRIEAAYAILEMRHKAKLTQTQLAKKMKVKQSLIARLESGTQNPTLLTLHSLAEACGKNLVWKFT